MMAKVEHLGVRDCFAHGLSQTESNVAVVNKTWYVSVSQGKSGVESKIGLGRRFASNLGLAHGDTVTVAPHQGHLTPLQRVWVSPLTANDWELLVSLNFYLTFSALFVYFNEPDRTGDKPG